MKSGFYTTTGSDQLSGWTEKKLQSTSQSQTCTEKRSWSLTVGLLPIRSTIASESQRNHYIWEVCSANWWDAPKTSMLAASIDQQKGPNSSPQQCPTTRHTTKASKVEWIGLWSFASLPYSPDLSPINHHFFKHLDNFLQGKCFHNQQDAENAFQGFTESWSLNFYATGKKTNFVGKNVLIVMVPILINKNVFEPSHIDLKFMVQNHSYFCTHIE